MALPLYADFAGKTLHDYINLPHSRGDKSPHPGLLFDKLIDGWKDDWTGLPEREKQSFFSRFAQAKFDYLKGNGNSGLHRALKKQKNLVHALNPPRANSFLHVKTDWRFVSGLGSGHPYETGFIWHRTLGLPFLPGSSVKGLMRAWAEQWEDDPAVWNKVDYLFGPAADKEESGAGSLIIFDALPVRPPALELDILNPHYGSYYQDPKYTPPADYQNPVPVFFLTVAPDQSFRFCLAPRPRADTTDPVSDVSLGLELLRKALKTLGAGGKTAVGYGAFERDHEEQNNFNLRLERESEKNLPIDERLRREISRKQPKDLVISLSRNWTQTKDIYGEVLETYLAIVKEIHGDEIQEKWPYSGKKNEKKAYNKVFPPDTQKR